jgi:hypothetical protein
MACTPPTCYQQLFSLKKIQKQCENTKILLVTMEITQNTLVKVQKIPQMQSLFFVFSKVKDVLLLCMEKKGPTPGPGWPSMPRSLTKKATREGLQGQAFMPDLFFLFS